MKIKSRILESELVENTERSGREDKSYYAVYYETQQQTLLPMLFTTKEITKAVERASKNPEDVRPPYSTPSMKERLEQIIKHPLFSQLIEKVKTYFQKS
jgi:hypothetical protein